MGRVNTFVTRQSFPPYRFENNISKHLPQIEYWQASRGEFFFFVEFGYAARSAR